MSRTTYYVMVPFRLVDGEFIQGEAVQARDAHTAKSAARLVAIEKDCGAIAFSRSGDPDLGDFDEAEILGKFGEVPDDAFTH